MLKFVKDPTYKHKHNPLLFGDEYNDFSFKQSLVDCRINKEIKSACCTPHDVIVFICRTCGISIQKNIPATRISDKNLVSDIIDKHNDLAGHKVIVNGKNICPFCNITFSFPHSQTNHLFRHKYCENVDNIVDDIREDRQRIEMLTIAISKDIDKTFGTLKDYYKHKSISPAIYDYVECTCGNGFIAKCMICGVSRNDDYGVVYGRKLSLYKTALIEHFNIPSARIKYDQRDLLIPIERRILDATESRIDQLESNPYRPEITSEVMSYQKRMKIIGYKCIICEMQYDGVELPSSDLVENHLSECLEPYKKFCKENGIRARHNPQVGKDFVDI